MARTPQFDYKSEEFLAQIKEMARKGLTDKEIALSLGLRPDTFNKKKKKTSQLSQVLQEGRHQLNSIVRQKYLALGLGGVKLKTVTRRKIEVDGKLLDDETIQEVETELAPNINVLATWLFHHDQEWKEKTIESKKMDITSGGKELDIQLTFNKTPLSEKDMAEIRNMKDGNNSETGSPDRGLSEA